MDYSFYVTTYAGNRIDSKDWERLSKRAEEHIKRYENMCVVTYFDPINGRNKAICALAEAVAAAEESMSNAGVSSVSVGSVSTTFSGETATQATLNRTALSTLRMYASIYRGGYGS